MNPEKFSSSTPSPIGKIMLLVVLVFCLAVGGFFLYVDMEAGREAEVLFARARDDFKNNRLDAGLKNVNRALRHRERSEYLVLKGDILLNRNKTSEGILVLERLTELAPDNPHYYYLLGNLCFNDGRHEEAIDHYRRAVEINPDNITYQIAKAAMLVRMNREDEAEAIYRRLIENDPNHYPAWEQYSTMHFNAGNLGRALEICEEAVRRFPDDYRYRFELATVLDHMKRKADAVREYRKSLELRPMKNSVAARRIYEMTGRRVPPALENQTTNRIAFATEDNLIFIEADINGRAGRFLLDTGASHAVIFDRYRDKYRLAMSPYQTAAETAGGVVQAEVGYGSLRLGPYDLEQVPIMVIPVPGRMKADGIIGMSVLQNFRFEIDRRDGLLTLTR